MSGSSPARRRSLKLAFEIAIGTVPIGVAGLALAKLLNTCTSPIRGLEVVGIACIVMALLLGLAELIARHQRSFGRVGLLDCLVVGIAQVGALIPGVSRSGSTLTAALFLGFKREEAARFSFLLGLPAIALDATGAEGIAKAAAERPDLILMDLNLPEIDGWEAARRLKADPATRDIPIIALTAHAMAGDREKALASGCDEFDTKPIEFDRLLTKIEQALVAKGRRQKF